MKHGTPTSGILTAPFRYLQITPRRVALPVMASAVGSVAVLPASLLIQRAVSEAQQTHGRKLVVFTLLSLAVQIAGSLLVLRSRRNLSAIFKTAAAARRADLLRAALDMPWVDRRGTDRSLLGRRIVSDLERVDAYAEAVLGLLVPAVLLLSAGLAVVLHLQVMLGLIVIASSIPIVATAAYSSLHLRKRHAALWTEHHRVSSVLDETLRADELFTDHGVVDRAVDRVREPLRAFATAAADQTNALSWSMQSQVITFAVSSAIVLGYAADQLADGHLTTPKLLVTLFALAVAQNGARMIVFALSPIISGRQALEALATWGSATRSETEAGRAAARAQGPLTSIDAIEARDVSFSYADDPVVAGLSTIVRRGETLVLRGDNGTGKSTLLGMLVGRIAPDSGSVLVNGRTMPSPFPTDVLKRIAVVGQESIVVRSTIEDNLLLLGASATPEEMRSALDTVGLPLALSHPVGDDGELLSGGQRRRLAVARALLRHPDMLFLDEPANHLDESTLELVRRLNIHVPRMGLVIVTHDDSLDGLADATTVRLTGAVSPPAGQRG